jgi:hypothetical protein
MTRVLDPKQPLWMPEGSVRSIIALVLVAVFALLALRSNVAIDPKDFASVVLLVVGAYFVAQAAKAAK